MPEETETGELPIDTFNTHDDPDAWEDMCDDPCWPDGEEEE